MKRIDWPKVVMIVVLLYLIVSTMAYRFTHPDMTETRLLQNIHNALIWRW